MKKILVISALLLLTGCASIVDGKNQQVNVETKPNGGTCTLSNDEGRWHVNAPDTVTVQRSLEDLHVQCKMKGLHGKATVVSGVKSMAFGNILFGGVIGAVVDRNNGAAYEYPPEIVVPMSAKGSLVRIVPPEPEKSEYPTSDYPNRR